MHHLESSGTPVLYIGRTVQKVNIFVRVGAIQCVVLLQCVKRVYDLQAAVILVCLQEHKHKRPKHAAS